MASDQTPQEPDPDMSVQQDSLSPAAATKKARRQTAFYPNTAKIPEKPFSRSAAKRESVMALGSIEHLQHYFTKTGLAARQNPLSSKNRLVPAIGPGLTQINTSSTDLEPHVLLPPSPMVPPPLPQGFPPFVKTYQTDPELLKPGVIEDLEAVERLWGLGQAGQHSSKPRDRELLGADQPNLASGNFDVLSALKTTTRTIRSVRNYLVSLPDAFATPRVSHHEFRPQSLSPQPASRKVLQPDSSHGPLALIRRAALEVLTALRNLEESSRIPLSDDVYEVQSDVASSSTRSHTPGGTERVASPFTSTSGDDDNESNASFSFSVVKVPTQKQAVRVWSDDEKSDGDADEKKEGWDERLVLGGGWLYKQDLSLDDLGHERGAIGRYLDVVDKALFDGHHQTRRGWEQEKERLAAEKRKESRSRQGRRASAGLGDPQSVSLQGGGRERRIVSTGMIDAMRNMTVSEEPEDMLQSVEEEEEDLEHEIDDAELPDWAKRSKFVDDPLARLLSLLVSLLPSDLLYLLPPPSEPDRLSLLLRLSSGQILCTAYNLAVRKSRKPWGYVNAAAIHDIVALEAKATAGDSERDNETRKIGWTFRRTDNLRLWAAALKLRYMVPLSLPKSSQGSTPLPSPVAGQQSFPTIDQIILFDPQVVAKRDEGWESMLENAVLKWMWCVVGERRGGK